MKSRIMTSLLLSLVLVTMVTAKPKVLFIESYHRGYEWSDGITEGIATTLGVKVDKNDKIDDSASPYEFKILRLDTKLFTGLKVKENATQEEIKAAQETFKKEAALKAKELIETWKPDVVIASDDNTSKYIIEPYYKNSDIPFVFCGVNWDASIYGFPCKNVTGMVEVALVPQLIDNLKTHAKGNRIGFLSADNETSVKDAKSIIEKFNLDLQCTHVLDFETWKKEYLAMQNSCDMLILCVPGIKGYDEEEAKKFVLENTRIPTGCIQEGETTISLIGYVKIPQEQGAWAATAAKQILEGKSPKDIEIVTNKKGKLYLNLPLADKMGISFPVSMVKHATIIKQ